MIVPFLLFLFWWEQEGSGDSKIYLYYHILFKYTSLETLLAIEALVPLKMEVVIATW